jgi:hypothetical protein
MSVSKLLGPRIVEYRPACAGGGPTRRFRPTPVGGRRAGLSRILRNPQFRLPVLPRAPVDDRSHGALRSTWNRHRPELRFRSAEPFALAGPSRWHGRAGTRSPAPIEDFAPAESDLYFGGVVKNGGFRNFDRTRQPAPLDKQTVVRLSRDTRYSAAVFHLDTGPVTVTLPDPGKRFMSTQVID